MPYLNPKQREDVLARYICAFCNGPASFVLDSESLICENCQTGRWLTIKPDLRDSLMSEASHEQEKERRHQVQERALHARYHLIRIDTGIYGVITTESRCETRDQEYTIYRFVDGLFCVTLDEAIRAVQSLNRGDTSEGRYAHS